MNLFMINWKIGKVRVGIGDGVLDEIKQELKKDIERKEMEKR